MSNILSRVSIVVLLGIGFMNSANASDPYAKVHASCKQELRLSDSGCDCVVNETKEKLNENQFAMFIAMISQNQSKMLELQPNMSGEDMLGLTDFMTKTPSMCQNQ